MYLDNDYNTTDSENTNNFSQDDLISKLGPRHKHKKGWRYECPSCHRISVTVKKYGSKQVVTCWDEQWLNKHCNWDEIKAALFGDQRRDYTPKQDKAKKPDYLKVFRLSGMSSEIRDINYRLILGQLTLSSKHRAKLLGRGYSDDEIDAIGFKTAPKLKKLDRAINESTPGTIGGQYLAIGKPENPNCPPGIIIPIYHNGKIIKLDLENDDRVKFSKYVSFSKNSDTSIVYREVDDANDVISELPMAYLPARPGVKKAILLEGVGHKPQITHLRTGAAVIGASSALFLTSKKQLDKIINELLANGFNEFYLAPDGGVIDGKIVTNQSILGQYTKLYEYLKAKGIELKILWFGQVTKQEGSIDDYLLDHSHDTLQTITWLEYHPTYKPDATNSQTKAKPKHQIKPVASKSRQLKALDRHTEFTQAFNELELSDQHREKLVRLGFSENQIETKLFKSLPKLCRLKTPVHPLTPGIYKGKFWPKYEGIVIPIFQDDLIVNYEVLLDFPNRNNETQILSSQAHNVKIDNNFPVMRISGKDRTINVVAVDEGYSSTHQIAEKTGNLTIGGRLNKLCTNDIVRGDDKKKIIFYPNHQSFQADYLDYFYQVGKTIRLLEKKGHDVYLAYWGQNTRPDKFIDAKKVQYLKWDEFKKFYRNGFSEYIKNKEFTPTKVVNERYLSPESCGFTESIITDTERRIIAIKSDMGTGKTESFGAVMPFARKHNVSVIALHAINSVSLQACERLGGLNHLNDGDNIEYRYEEGARVSCCVNSVPKLFSSNFDNAILYIDEAEDVASAITNEGTLDAKTRQQVMLTLVDGLARAKTIVLMDFNLSNKTVDFFATVAKISNVTKLYNLAISEYGPVSLSIGNKEKTKAESLATIDILRRVIENGENVVIACDSQTFGQAFGLKLIKLGINPNDIMRVDSQTKSGKLTKAIVNQFLGKPVETIQQVMPKVLIYSPTMKAGVSISKARTWPTWENPEFSGLANGYFSKGYFFRSHICTNDAMQMKARVRDAIPWDIWTVDRKHSTDGLPNTVSIQIETKMLEDSENLKVSLDLTDPFVIHNIKQTQILNYDKTALGDNLYQQLKKQGCQVELVDSLPDPDQVHKFDDEKLEVLMARATVIFNAAPMDIKTARKVKSSFSASEEAIASADRAILLDDLPGLETSDLWSPETIKTILFQKANLRSQIYYQLLAQRKELVDVIQNRRNAEIVRDFDKIYLPDQGQDITTILAWEKIGLLDWVKVGAVFDDDDLENITKKMARHRFGAVSKQSPLKYLNSRLTKFGVKAKRQEGSIKIVSLIDNTDPLTALLNECILRRLNRENLSEKNSPENHTGSGFDTNIGTPSKSQKKLVSSIEKIPDKGDGAIVNKGTRIRRVLASGFNYLAEIVGKIQGNKYAIKTVWGNEEIIDLDTDTWSLA